MTLKERLGELVAACFTGVWIESHEHHEAIREILELCRREEWKLAVWDVDQGLQLTGVATGHEANDPLAAIRALSAMAADETTILVIKNLHRFVASTEVMQALQTQLLSGRHDRRIIIGLSPVVSIPSELEKLFVVVEHELPSHEQLEEIAREVATEDGELPAEDEFGIVLDAAAGLTRLEAENAFSLSLVRHGRLTAESLWELKTGTLKKSGLLNLYKGEEDFSSLGGLQSLKAFCKRSLLRRSGTTNVKAKGVMLLGVPGTGKSAFAKCLGRETGRPTLVLDIGALMGSLVGQTESNVRRALGIADAMAPCILFVDEIEKALGGVAGSGTNDSGVSARMFGTLLSWMNDHTSDVYLIATCNDISRMPPELSRAERFDGIVFLDLPQRDQKDQIWSHYVAAFGLDMDQAIPADEDWTGAEIRACCRLAALLDVPLTQAAQNVVPVAVTASESVNNLRTWASGRCLDAEQGGIYQSVKPKSSSRRKVTRGPSMN
ncbi:MAG: AAA family ATPase [Fuerstiella sp.]